MKKQKNIFFTVISCIIIVIATWAISWVALSLKTPSPIKEQLKYFDNTTCFIVMALFAPMFIVGCWLSHVNSGEIKVTDEKLKEEIELKARKLINETFDKLTSQKD